MAKANTKLSDFRAAVKGQHLPRADRYEVEFNLPGALIANYPGVSRSLTIFCEEAQIPGLSAQVEPVKIGAWQEYRIKNVDFLGQESVFTFIADEKWAHRHIFEDWIFYAANPNTKELAFPDEIFGSIVVKSLSQQDQVLGKWTLIDSIPKLLNLIPVSAGSPGPLRISLTVSSIKWIYEPCDAVEDTRKTNQISGNNYFEDGELKTQEIEGDLRVADGYPGEQTKESLRGNIRGNNYFEDGELKTFGSD